MDERSIEINFSGAMAKADALEQIADEMLRSVNNEYEGAMQMVNAGWKGGNAETYLAKGSKLEGQMRTTINQLRQAAEEIRRSARRTYNAEMEALRIIREKLLLQQR